MLESKKHCVAIGGAVCCGTWAGIFKALAAACGSCNPVPSANFAINCNLPVAPNSKKI